MRHIDAPATRPTPCAWPMHPSMRPVRHGGPPCLPARPRRSTPRLDRGCVLPVDPARHRHAAPPQARNGATASCRGQACLTRAGPTGPGNHVDGTATSPVRVPHLPSVGQVNPSARSPAPAARPGRGTPRPYTMTLYPDGHEATRRHGQGQGNLVVYGSATPDPPGPACLARRPIGPDMATPTHAPRARCRGGGRRAGEQGSSVTVARMTAPPGRPGRGTPRPYTPGSARVRRYTRSVHLSLLPYGRGAPPHLSARTGRDVPRPYTGRANPVDPVRRPGTTPALRGGAQPRPVGVRRA